MGIKKFTNINSNTTTNVNGDKQTMLLGVIVGKAGSASQAVVYNGNPSAGDIVATLDTSNVDTFSFYGVYCPDGVYLVTSGTSAADITVIWK